MGLIDNLDRPAVEVAPGVLRRAIVGQDTGAALLTTGLMVVSGNFPALDVETLTVA